MKGFNLNISTLFSSLGSGNGLGSFNFGEYASIKNGSYGKLLKAYYTEQKKTTDTDQTTEKPKKEQSVDKTGLSQMKKEADGLKSAAEALQKEELWKQTDGKYDKEKIVDAVQKFAKAYNDTLTQAGKVNSKDIGRDVSYMSSMTGTMSKALARIGVTVGADGKLSVDEDSLKKAKESSIKGLLGETVSYGSQIAGKAGEIARDAVMNSSIYGNNATLTSSMNNMFDKWI